MGLLGFQNRPVSGPKIVDAGVPFKGPRGPFKGPRVLLKDPGVFFKEDLRSQIRLGASTGSRACATILPGSDRAGDGFAPRLLLRLVGQQQPHHFKWILARLRAV